MTKYKCIKTQCPICGNTGSLQLFINKENRITYARVRHYKGKGKFNYCKIEDLEAMKTLLNGQYGQGKTVKNIDHKQKNPSPKVEIAGPVGFEPTTFSLEG
jgi:hypothetical protein